MKTDIELQIKNWENSKMMYENEEITLKQSITTMEIKRKRMDSDYTFSPRLDSYYKRLDSLYEQLHTLPAKINKCIDHISTLKMCKTWN